MSESKPKENAFLRWCNIAIGAWFLFAIPGSAIYCLWFGHWRILVTAVILGFCLILLTKGAEEGRNL